MVGITVLIGTAEIAKLFFDRKGLVGCHLLKQSAKENVTRRLGHCPSLARVLLPLTGGDRIPLSPSKALINAGQVAGARSFCGRKRKIGVVFKIDCWSSCIDDNFVNSNEFTFFFCEVRGSRLQSRAGRSGRSSRCFNPS